MEDHTRNNGRREQERIYYIVSEVNKMNEIKKLDPKKIVLPTELEFIEIKLPLDVRKETGNTIQGIAEIRHEFRYNITEEAELDSYFEVYEHE